MRVTRDRNSSPSPPQAGPGSWATPWTLPLFRSCRPAGAPGAAPQGCVAQGRSFTHTHDMNGGHPVSDSGQATLGTAVTQPQSCPLAAHRQEGNGHSTQVTKNEGRHGGMDQDCKVTAQQSLPAAAQGRAGASCGLGVCVPGWVRLCSGVQRGQRPGTAARRRLDSSLSCVTSCVTVGRWSTLSEPLFLHL